METINRPDDAAVLAQGIIDNMAAPFELGGGREVYATVSIGIALFPGGAPNANQIRDADAAMYKAKEGGGNAFRLYTENLTRLAHERLELEANLRRALVNDEFVLEYQPQVRGRRRGARRLRGAGALELAARPGAAGRVHTHRRGHGAHRPAGRMGLARRLRAGRALGRDRVRWGVDGDQRLAAAVPATRSRRQHPPVAGRDRPFRRGPRARHDRVGDHRQRGRCHRHAAAPEGAGRADRDRRFPAPATRRSPR